MLQLTFVLFRSNTCAAGGVEVRKDAIQVQPKRGLLRGAIYRMSNFDTRLPFSLFYPAIRAIGMRTICGGT